MELKISPILCRAKKFTNFFSGLFVDTPVPSIVEGKVTVPDEIAVTITAKYPKLVKVIIPSVAPSL